MSFTKKPFQELDVLDDFLINAIATNPEVGKPFCHRLLSVRYSSAAPFAKPRLRRFPLLRGYIV